jgi:hypothetical protein
MLSHKSWMTIWASFTVLCVSGCADRFGPEPSLNLATTPVPTDSVLRVIQLGHRLVGEIHARDPECLFMTVGGGWGGLCDAFEVTVPAHGTLLTAVQWSADAPFALFLKTPAGEQIDMICCGSPMVLQSSADSGVVYRLELAYVGRPSSYPQIPSVYYTIEAALLPVEAQSARGLRAIVFGDPARTQWLSRARLEVVQGALSGTVAHFHNGAYDLVGLPAGFVEIRLSADGFDTVTKRLPVGAKTARELVLRRSKAFPSANSLSGLTRVAEASTNNFTYEGVMVEILDGPLAGVFTFSDEFGVYELRSLAAGLTRLRASRAGLQPQELSVTVSGDTGLDFVMQKR